MLGTTSGLLVIQERFRRAQVDLHPPVQHLSAADLLRFISNVGLPGQSRAHCVETKAT